MQGGNLSQRHRLGRVGHHHVESLFVGYLQQFLELSLVVSHIVLCLHNVVFILCSLSGELSQVGFRHLADLYHLLATVLVLQTRLIALLVHVDGLGGVEYLDVELGYLLLQFGCLCGRIELCSLAHQFVELHLRLSLAAVVKGVVAHHAVRAVVVHLVDGSLGVSVTRDAVGHPWRVVDILVGRSAERWQQGCLRLQIVFVGTLCLQTCFLQRDVVGQGVVDAVFQTPLTCLCREGH